jgi:hypothetical protein
LRNQTVRSTHYQHLFAEVCVDDEHLSVVPSEPIEPPSPQSILLNQKAQERLLFLIRTKGTKRQNQIVQGLLKDQTQLEIARDLDITQGTVCHFILGNFHSGPQYGLKGTIPRLALRDNTYRLLIQQMDQRDQYDNLIHDPPSTYHLTRSWFSSTIDFLDWLDTPIDYRYKIPTWKVAYIHAAAKLFLQTKELPTRSVYLVYSYFSKTLDMHAKLAQRIWTTYISASTKQPPTTKIGTLNAKAKKDS